MPQKMTIPLVREAKLLRGEGRPFEEVAARLSKSGRRISEATVRRYLKGYVPPSTKAAPALAAAPASVEAVAVGGHGTSTVRVTRIRGRGPFGAGAIAHDRAWRLVHQQLEAALEEALETADSVDAVNALRLELYEHAHPELSHWRAHPGIDGEVVEALMNAGDSDALLLVSTPAAFASLARHVTEHTDGAEQNDARAIAMLEGALVFLREAAR